MVWWGTAGELADNAFESTYRMRNLETGEELTQLYFSLKEVKC